MYGCVETNREGGGEPSVEMANQEDRDLDQVVVDASAWVMTECREFVKRTFTFLPAKELNTCARVCKVWQREAHRILSRRQDLNWVSELKSCHTTNEKTTHPLGFFGHYFQKTTQSIGPIPKFALMFTEYSKGLDYRSIPGQKKKKSEDNGPQKSQEVVDYFKSLLPQDCVLLSLMTPGIVVPKDSLSTKPGMESEGEGGATCALFPNIPGVRINLLPISPKLLQGGYKEELWQRWLEAGISPNDTQCVLLFGWGFISGVQQAAAELQRLFQEKARKNPVIAGGIVNRLLSKGLCSKSEESSGVIGVTFSGPNVKAISVILNEQVRTRSEAKTAIARLKEANLPVRPKFSLGFMFACAGRGQHFYEEDNVESEEFHKLFPDTPLFGFFGGGEIGCYNLTAGRDIEGLLLSNTAHAYTTIMCLLTFDPS
ncbi:F-box only protein 22 [Strongylocentrotus purpuratus]|uniref:FIST C-domain domain-containing protein n=1 Tax=Strongylocentrotus purpuratus TaxID=7668 RepID=A0A7M7RI92_STRPU|nr:F-box only protein 22 [Strongylocentrotus purpuratus]|eukprot:XP_794413.2 PREDICTED: F-box only protein 22 [Strongylocentrotus purpuratus]